VVCPLHVDTVTVVGERSNGIDGRRGHVVSLRSGGVPLRFGGRVGGAGLHRRHAAAG
jgi:hypothetical protein